MAKKRKGQIAFPEVLEKIISRDVVDTPSLELFKVGCGFVQPGLVEGVPWQWGWN